MRPLGTVAALALCLAGCHGGREPVARVAVEPRQIQLPYPQVTELRLTWEPYADLGVPGGARPTVFVHLLDAGGEIVRTFDHALPERWLEGTPVSYPLDLRQSALAPPLPAGTYRLTLGLYDGHSRRRWPLQATGEDVGHQEYRVADVAVPAPRPGGPRFTFSREWLPAEPGPDLQSPARRWLGAEGGSIEAAGLSGAGAVWMVLTIPQVGPGDEIAYVDRTNVPAAVVSGDCGGMETVLSGVGNHQIEIAVGTAPPGGACRIEVRSNFRFSARGDARARSVSLDDLAWDPSGASGGS